MSDFEGAFMQGFAPPDTDVHSPSYIALQQLFATWAERIAHSGTTLFQVRDEHRLQAYQA
jgi:hypothetical protein